MARADGSSVCSCAKDAADEGTKAKEFAQQSRNDISAVWSKSSFCNNSACIEVACTSDHVLLRSSKQPGGPILRFTIPEWKAFVEGIRNGEFIPD